MGFFETNHGLLHPYPLHPRKWGGHPCGWGPKRWRMVWFRPSSCPRRALVLALPRNICGYLSRATTQILLPIHCVTRKLCETSRTSLPEQTDWRAFSIGPKEKTSLRQSEERLRKGATPENEIYASGAGFERRRNSMGVRYRGRSRTQLEIQL